MSDMAGELKQIGERVRDRFVAEKRVLSFEEYLGEVSKHTWRHTRDSARYLRDCIDFYGSYEVPRPWGKTRRFRLFDLPFESKDGELGSDRLVGHEAIQQAFYRALGNFVREGRPNRLVLLHGPNGSAKSTFADCLMRALQHYSKQPEGALYRFSWIFPRGSDGKVIGFGSRDDNPGSGEPYAHYPESRIDVKLQSAMREHPLLLLPRSERTAMIDEAYAECKVTEDPPVWIVRGELGQKNRKIYDALLTAYRGDLMRVFNHVQVERYTFSKRYRTGAVTIGPQMAVDASERQITADHSLAALPASLSALTLYEPFGELVDASGGLIEYSDLLKRPLDAWKYLLLAIESGEVSLPLSTLPLNSVMLASSNELHLSAFKEHPDYHSFRGRIQLVRVPYLLDYRQEQAIYDAQIVPHVRTHVAPHATYVAALWAVLSRMRQSMSAHFSDTALGELARDLTPLEKAEILADGTVPKRFGSEQSLVLRNGIRQIAQERWKGPVYEGLTGASPREVRTLLLDAVQHADYRCLSPLAVLSSIMDLVSAGDFAFLREEGENGYREYASFLEQVRERWLDRVDNEFRDCTGLVEEAQYLDLFTRYITHVSHQIKRERIYNRVTSAYEDPDRELMDGIERTLGVEGDPEEFRRSIISTVAGHAIDNPGESVDYALVFPRQLATVKEAYFGERRRQVRGLGEDILSMLNDTEHHGLSEERLESAQQTVTRLEALGYEPESIRDALGELVTRRYQD